MAPLFPIMIALTLITIIVQVRWISAMVMVFATAPLGLIGVTPTLLLFQQPIGIYTPVGLIALSGTVQRSRPVILTVLAAMLAFIPLTHSVIRAEPSLASRFLASRR